MPLRGPQKGPERPHSDFIWPWRQGMEGPWSSWDNTHTEKKRMLSPAGRGLVDRGKHREKSRVWATAETLINQAIVGGWAGSRPTRPRFRLLLAEARQPQPLACSILKPDAGGRAWRDRLDSSHLPCSASPAPTPPEAISRASLAGIKGVLLPAQPPVLFPLRSGRRP